MINNDKLKKSTASRAYKTPMYVESSTMSDACSNTEYSNNIQHLYNITVSCRFCMEINWDKVSFMIIFL